ncbi:MAG: hypothetical protein K9M10_02115 [Candidatus Pacebacteria bacterium]|nr:hypothetical protein [Candidatus Paceibacterota bacterium]MCF7857259.1 hypothetical protein [Candidatus Paceibacterota bacterium]
MSDVLHANIFFFITGIAVIVFTALLCIVLFHVIKAIKSLRRILNRIEEGTEIIAEDIGQFRAYFTEDGFIKRLLKSILGASPWHTEHGGRSTKKSEKRRTELTIKE